MKTFALIATLFIGSASFADTIVLQAGNSATIYPGQAPSVVVCGGQQIPTQIVEFKCTLTWTSTYGDAMTPITGIGSTPEAARAQVRESCRTAPGQGNAAKCMSIAGSAVCETIRY